MRTSSLACLLPLSILAAVACGSSTDDSIGTDTNATTSDASADGDVTGLGNDGSAATGDGSVAVVTDSGGAPTGDPSDPGADAGACTNSPAGVTITETATVAQGKVYKVSYQVEGSERLAQMCVPSSAGPHPIFVVNHGGFVGLANELTDRVFCNVALTKGYIAIEAQYRGEEDVGFGKSGGNIEFCNGEATDIIELLKVTKRRCDADPKRVAALGISHGGCNTLQMVGRGVPLKAAIDIVGPTNASSLYDYHQSNRTTGNATEQKAHNELADAIPIWAGGTPTSNPQAYADRSPYLRAKYMTNTPMMIFHGTTDFVVPHSNSCQLHDALVSNGVNFVNFHLNTFLLPTTDQVSGCASTTYSTSVPASFTGDHYFAIFDGQGHAFDTAPGAVVLNAVNSFLDSHM